MLGFQTDWDIECLVFDWTQIGVILGLGFIAKQRSGFGFGYMSFTLMRGNNPEDTVIPPCYQASGPSLQGYHFTLSFKPLQLTGEQPTSPVFNQIQKSKQKSHHFQTLMRIIRGMKTHPHVRPKTAILQ